MTLRPYQETAVEWVRSAWAGGERPLLCLPTGSGKTVVAHELARDGALVVAHTRQIVEQTAARFAPSGVLMGSGSHGLDLPVVVASIQTIARRGAPERPVLIVDECHHATAKTYRDIVAGHPRVVGLTATPERLDGTGLREAGFTIILEPARFTDLVSQGYLAEPIVYGSRTAIPKRALKTRAGEFTPESGAEAMKSLAGEIKTHWSKHARGRKAVAFACTIAHAEAVAADLASVGARAASVSGDDDPSRRADVLAALREGDLDVLVNCQLLGEGWDLPALDCAILARPTKSLAVHRQQCGRVTRPSPGKPRPIILDHAGNTKRFGFVTEDVAWSLDGREPDDRDTIVVSTCQVCFAMYRSTLRECPQCGYGRVTVARPRPVETVEELEVLKPEIPHPNRWTKPDERAYADLVYQAWSKGYKIGWALYRYKHSFGAWPGSWCRAIEVAYGYARTQRTS